LESRRRVRFHYPRWPDHAPVQQTPAARGRTLAVEFSRVNGFASDELHTIKALATPKDGQYGRGVTNAFDQQRRLIVSWEQHWLIATAISKLARCKTN
jgi:hypothetical protein